MEDYEKLQLSKQDLNFLYDQLLNEILTKLDLHLPTSNDPLKLTVLNLLNNYLIEIFEMSKHSMTIDGIENSSDININEIVSLKSREKTEPFNHDLNNQLRLVLQAVEQETIEVTNLRKSIPVDIRNVYEQIVVETDSSVSKFLQGESQAEVELSESEKPEESQNIALEDPRLENPESENPETEKPEHQPQEANTEPSNTQPIGNNSNLDIPRIEQIIKDYETHLIELNELKDLIPKQRSELNKLNDITQFLQDKYDENNVL